MKMARKSGMRLCSYTVVHDTGFAPNPFGGYCTLAACTPNHQGINLSRGDWLVGHATAKRAHRLIYAMKVFDALDFDTYYNDSRFESKKPRFDRTWREACGDNIYYLTDGGVWMQHPTNFHDDPESRAQDTRNPRVFVSKHFHYFGANAPKIPKQFSPFIRDRQGCKCDYPVQLVKTFVKWLEMNFTPGVLGEPFDFIPIQTPTRITHHPNALAQVRQVCVPDCNH